MIVKRKCADRRVCTLPFFRVFPKRLNEAVDFLGKSHRHSTKLQRQKREHSKSILINTIDTKILFSFVV